ncbi:GtrA family protein [Trueperella bonasi]
MRTRFGQLVRFGITGVANTAVYYLSYRLFLLVLHYLPAHLLAWVVSVVFSFFMNSYFTYRVRPTWRKFFQFPLTSIVNLIFTSLGSIFLVETLHVDERYATLIMGILAIPITFSLTTLILDRDEPSRK